MKKLMVLMLAVVMSVCMIAGASAAQYDGVELTYWSMWNSTEPQGEVIKQVVAAFEEKTGAKVNVEWKGRDINTIIAAALEAGEKIDLFDEDYQRIANSYAAYTADLGEMAAAAGYKGYDCFNNQVKAWTGGILNSIVEQPQVGGVFYNKDRFAEAGIAAEPVTWEEYVAVSKQLKDAGIAPQALDAAYADFTFYYHLVRHLGEEKIAELAVNGKWSENAEAVKAAQEIVDYVKAGYMADGAPDEYPSGQNKIGTGEAAMVVCANYVTSELNALWGDLNWGLFNYPVTGENTAAYAGANSMAITSYSENKQAAFDFIMMMVTGEYDQLMADTAAQIPCDPANVAPKHLTGTVETLLAAAAPMSWCNSINAKEGLGTSFKTLATELYAGKYESGEAFCAAMDALY